MKRFEEYNRLLYGRSIGWRGRKRVVNRHLTPQDHDMLLSLLGHWKTRLRWSAATRLGQIGDRRATGPLIAALGDPHWLVRLHAARALGRIGDQAAVQSLVEAMGDESAFVRRRVVLALKSLVGDKNEEVYALFVAALSDPDKQVRANAAWCLRGVTSAEVVAALVAVIGDEDANVSWRAVEALERIGWRAVEPLIDLLDHPDSRVRYRVVKTLGRMRAWRAVKPLEAVQDDPEEKVRWRTGFALEQICGRRRA
jgi:HEAT repeat protein